jgi:hypothetical protein
MDDAELVHARESIDEPEWTHAPPVAQPVDPSEVPELGTFFFHKRVTLARASVVVVAAAIASLGGLARAIADEWDEPIVKDPILLEHRLIPVAASATP